MTALADGKVLVAGGGDKGEYTASAEVYDPDTDTWSETESMEGPRVEHRATLLGNGQVLVTGGVGKLQQQLLSSAEVYDPVTGTWSSTGNLSTDLHRHRIVTLPDGAALVIGGFTLTTPGARDFQGKVGHVVAKVEEYDQTRGTWRIVGSIASERRNHTVTVLDDGSVLVLVVGGVGTTGQLQETSELYRPGQ